MGMKAAFSVFFCRSKMKKWRFFPKFAERIKIERLKIMDNETKLKIEEKIIDMLKTVYDPEIPVNIYDLGLIYKIEMKADGQLDIDMTLTAPNCPAVDFIVEDVRQKVESVEGVTSATINIVFDPDWDKDMMSVEAKLELGFL